MGTTVTPTTAGGSRTTGVTGATRAPAARRRRARAHNRARAVAEAEQRFDVMGTRAHLLVVAGPNQARADALVHVGAARLRTLHDRWTRFSDLSDVGRCNANAGQPVTVHRDTLLLVERACEAWRATSGRFDPTVLAAVVGAGYDRDFHDLATVKPRTPRDAKPAPGCSAIVVDWSTRMITLPHGVGFDPGGIGKG